MKRYVKASKDSDWQSHLPEAVYDRLCDCKSKRTDIVPLASAYYKYSDGARMHQLTPQDCVAYMLEWVLDWNGGTWTYSDRDLTRWTNAVERSK